MHPDGTSTFGASHPTPEETQPHEARPSQPRNFVLDGVGRVPRSPHGSVHTRAVRSALHTIRIHGRPALQVRRRRFWTSRFSAELPVVWLVGGAGFFTAGKATPLLLVVYSRRAFRLMEQDLAAETEAVCPGSLVHQRMLFEDREKLSLIPPSNSLEQCSCSSASSPSFAPLAFTCPWRGSLFKPVALLHSSVCVKDVFESTWQRHRRRSAANLHLFSRASTAVSDVFNT